MADVDLEEYDFPIKWMNPVPTSLVTHLMHVCFLSYAWNNAQILILIKGTGLGNGSDPK